MEIKTYLNTTQEEVENKSFNIWVGISLGNKFFIKENIKEYILWAQKNTKDNVLVVVADAIQAYNFEVLDKISFAQAQRKAARLGDVKFNEVKEILSQLPKEQQQLVNVVRWSETTFDLEYQKNLILVRNEFKTNPEFHQTIIEIVKKGRSDRYSTLSKLVPEKLDRLAEYVLNELPHFINGVRGHGNNFVYNLIPYPVLSDLDLLTIGVNNKKLFPELANKLAITTKVAVVEAYV